MALADSTLIVFDAATATAVAGNDSSGAALDPLPLSDGRFFLPSSVLTDPAHQAHWDALTAASTGKEWADIQALLPPQLE